MKQFVAFVGSVAVMLCAARPAQADPLILSGVVAAMQNRGFGTVHLITDEFDIGGTIDGNLFDPCGPCMGVTVNLGAGFSSELVNYASGTIQSVEYPSVAIETFLTFITGSVPLPAGSAGDVVTLTAPFTARGGLNAQWRTTTSSSAPGLGLVGTRYRRYR
jgi:hypothetical protein